MSDHRYSRSCVPLITGEGSLFGRMIDSLIYRNFYIGSAGKCDIGSDSRISGCLVAFEDACCRKDLGTMADCGDGFACRRIADAILWYFGRKSEKPADFRT